MSNRHLAGPLVAALLLTGAFAMDAGAQNRHEPRDRHDRHDQRDRHDRDDRGRGRDDRGRGQRHDPRHDPRGGGSITIFEHAGFRGRSATFDRPVRNLQAAGMNDVTSSLRLRGAWLVCEHADFGGRCQVVDNAVRDFQHSGLNDRISSLRPADRRDYRR